MIVRAYAAGLSRTFRHFSATRAKVSWVKSQASCWLPVSVYASPSSRRTCAAANSSYDTSNGLCLMAPPEL